MRAPLRISTIAMAGMFVLSAGCATRGQLRRGLAEQAAALEAERSARIAGDQRIAADVAALRADLDALRKEFGTRITMMEDGMHFVVPVHFGFDRSDLNPEAEPVLSRFSEVVQNHYRGAKITVEGFADPAGSAAYNRQLSRKRAEAVRTHLVEQGVPRSQLTVVGYGEERPVVPGASGGSYGADLNRRVVFVVETPPDPSLPGMGGAISAR
ncbi:MAG: OmpA family protein [Gemmatimonadetes bacterium]|nr:OmpA family protein [Gemmatimonadota bacterium]